MRCREGEWGGGGKGGEFGREREGEGKKTWDRGEGWGRKRPEVGGGGSGREGGARKRERKALRWGEALGKDGKEETEKMGGGGGGGGEGGGGRRGKSPGEKQGVTHSTSGGMD